MSLRALLKFGGITAILAGLSSIAFGVLFLFVVPDAQKGAAPAALTSFATNPTAAQVVIALTLFGALCTLPAIVGIYYRLSEKDRGWAAV
jgi:hypothetical protein